MKSKRTRLETEEQNAFESWCERRTSLAISHAQGRGQHGFPFPDEYWMNVITEKRDIRVLLDAIENQAPLMGLDYSNAFRYVLYEDIFNRLEQYVRHIQRRIPVEERMEAYC